MLCVLRSIYCPFCCKSSKSIDSINSQNTFVCLDISSCLISIHSRWWLNWCFRTSLCVLVFSQWNSRWSMVWSFWPHIHLALSLSLNRYLCACVRARVCVRARACVYECLTPLTQSLHINLLTTTTWQNSISIKKNWVYFCTQFMCTVCFLWSCVL